MNSKHGVIFAVLLIGCTPTNSMTTSAPISSTSIPPQPENFEKLRDGNPIIYEKTNTISFSRENILSVDPFLLLPQNYRETEDGWVPYVRDEEPVQDPVFNNHRWTEAQLAASLDAYEVPTQDAFIALLESWLPFDDAFISREENVNIRNLSHEFFNGEYYWFNNYLDAYTMQYSRVNNAYIFGTTQIERTFQTLNHVSFERIRTTQYDETSIYALQDETYPVGFFGAVDQKVITPRAGDNTHHALSLGPVRYLLDTFAYWSYLIDNAASDTTVSPYAIQFNLERSGPQDLNLQIRLTQPLDTLRSEEYLEHTLDAKIRSLEWTEFVETEFIWLNEDRA